MLIQFRLAWLRPNTPAVKGFKFSAAGSLFQEYTERITKFVSCETAGMPAKSEKKSLGVYRWLCERQGKAVSSEILANLVQTLMEQGARRLEIIISGPNGFSSSEIELLKPDFKWSFGPLTFPHELAAVIAAEQVYRAWAILRKMPYHLGH